MSLYRTLSALPVWRRNQYVTVALVFIVFAALALVLPFTPLYVRELGVHDQRDVALWSGLVIAVAPLLAALLAPVWGRLADRRGHKRMVLRALVAYVIVLGLSAVVTNVYQLFLLRALLGVFGGIGPLGLTMATALAPREETGHAVGLVQSAQILAAAIGPVVGGVLADTAGIRATFALTALACLGTLVMMARFYAEMPRTGAGGVPSAAPHGTFSEVLRVPRVPLLLATLFLMNLGARGFPPILPAFLQSLGAPEARLALLTGVLISAYSIAAALSASLYGRAGRRRPARPLLALSLASGALVVLLLALAPGVASACVLATLLGLLSGGALTLGYTIGGLLVPEHVRGTAFGFFSGAALCGTALSFLVAGLLAHFDLRGIFYFNALVFFVLAAVLVPALRGPGDAHGGAPA